MIGKIVQDLHNQSILFLCITQMLQWEARLGFYNWLIIPSSHVVVMLLTWLFRYLDKRSRLVISCFKLSCIWTSRHFGVFDSHVTSQMTSSTVFFIKITHWLWIWGSYEDVCRTTFIIDSYVLHLKLLIWKPDFE